MSEGQDGAPAFPRKSDQYGVDLRDWFAGQAAEGLVAAADWNEARELGPKVVFEHIAKSSYLLADAMLDAREKEVS